MVRKTGNAKLGLLFDVIHFKYDFLTRAMSLDPGLAVAERPGFLLKKMVLKHETSLFHHRTSRPGRSITDPARCHSLSLSFEVFQPRIQFHILFSGVLPGEILPHTAFHQFGPCHAILVGIDSPFNNLDHRRH